MVKSRLKFTIGLFLFAVLPIATLVLLLSSPAILSEEASKKFETEFGLSIIIPNNWRALTCEKGKLVDFYPVNWSLSCDDLRQPGQVGILGPIPNELIPERENLHPTISISGFKTMVSSEFRHGDQNLLFYQATTPNGVYEISVDISDVQARAAFKTLILK